MGHPCMLTSSTLSMARTAAVSPNPQLWPRNSAVGTGVDALLRPRGLRNNSRQQATRTRSALSVAVRGVVPPPFRFQPRRTIAASAGSSPDNYSFELGEYVEAKVDYVQHSEKHGHIIFLKVQDDTGNVVPLYIGESECISLLAEIEKQPKLRPMTHDLMKNSMDSLGFRIAKVCVTALVGNTYHASIHYLKAKDATSASQETVVDSRPSDAINLAVRCGAAIYINKDVASKMGYAIGTYDLPKEETQKEIINSVRSQILQFNDPTYMYKLQMQLAIQEERYDDAGELRDKIEAILANNREVGLVVAMETALEDERYEEAAALRDEFRRLQAHKGKKKERSDSI